MADKDETEHVYRLPRINRYFAISGVVLTATVLWMIWADYAREWKQYQVQFNRMEVERARNELKATAARVETPEFKKLKEELAAAEQDLKAKTGDVRKLEKELTRQNGAIYKADQAWRFARAIYDVDRYDYETALAAHEKGLEKKKADLDRQFEKIRELDDTVKKLTAERDAVQAQLAAVSAGRTEIQKKVSQATQELTVLETKLERIEPGFKSAILNAPLLDFMKPTLQVKQILVPDLTFDMNFAGALRVDRCTTCHLAIDKVGYEDAPQPFRTHPRLDTFLSSKSPHSIEQFGCTTCHGGSGWATDFVNAAHTPSGHEQEKEWKEKYGWHELHMWDYPMLEKGRVESSCLKCHYEQQPHIPGAPVLNHGMELIEKSGCYGCHNLRGYEDLRKVGPSLENIASKVSPDWINRWIADPTSFTEYARMPRFFGVAAEPTEKLVQRERTEIASLTKYIVSVSGQGAGHPAPPSGNVLSGQNLFDEIGCRGCHVLGDPPDAAKTRSSPMRFGPELSGTGSKLDPGWVFAWLKDPKHYWDETRMPNMRLTDQEAADLTAFLISNRNTEFEEMPVVQSDPAVVDEIAMEYLTQRATVEAATAQLGGMSAADRELFVGEKMVTRYGCFGCHDITGFENAQPIGTALTTEGSKKAGQMDFGVIHDIPHTTSAWITRKLLEPRIFDTGRVKSLDERLKMPKFGFTEEEAEAISVALMGYTKENIVPHRRVQFTAEEALVQKGVWMTEELNCIGCHVIGERGGAIRPTIEDQGYWPPPLTGEGAKVRSEWLFSFLKHPSPIRPWLKVRMPTFEFTDDEVNTLIRYFASDAGANYFLSDQRAGADPEYLAAGKLLFEQFQCLKCHDQDRPGVSAADRAPDLAMARERLRGDWIEEWLLDPQAIQEGTRMPTFFYEGVSPNQTVFGGDTRKQLQAMRTYIMTLSPSGKGR